MFERIRKWYKQRLWNEAQVRKAVEKNVLTAEEAAGILLEEK